VKAVKRANPKVLRIIAIDQSPVVERKQAGCHKMA
jgi:hypothetical protein